MSVECDARVYLAAPFLFCRPALHFLSASRRREPTCSNLKALLITIGQ
jgi:hypothetical protein